VGGGASLIGVSRSPTLSILGGLVGRESKFDLGFLCEHDGPRGTGRNMLGVDGNNHRSGLLGVPRISARVKVPGSENWSRFVIEDCLLDMGIVPLHLDGGNEVAGRDCPVAWQLGLVPGCTRGCCLPRTIG